jgi:hypothetical protein
MSKSENGALVGEQKWTINWHLRIIESGPIFKFYVELAKREFERGESRKGCTG